MTGFSFNNRHSSEFGVVMRSRDRPLLPSLRHRETIIPGRDGIYDYGGNTHDIRIIELDCSFAEKNLPDYRARIRSIAKWLSYKGTLIFDDEPDKYFIGRIYNTVSLEQMYVAGEFTLIFECEPFAYGRMLLEETKIKQNGQAIRIKNGGTVDAPCLVVIRNNRETPTGQIDLWVEKE